MPSICGGAACQFREGFCPGDGDPDEPGGVPTMTGRCVSLGYCEPPLEVDEVCGCDGETYFTDYDAVFQGVSIRHRGACE
jgi:hypothetical protein